jgi:hypothetical protein
MRIFAATFAFFAYQSLASQSVFYRIDPTARDSFFLVETLTTKATAESPRPTVTESHQLFRSMDELWAFLEYLKDQARQAEKNAQEAERQMNEAMALRARLDSAANKIEAAIKNKDAP